MEYRNEWNLQLFADGGEGAAAPAAEAAGETAEAQQPTEPTFDEILASNPSYKAAYEHKLRGHLSNRMKTVNEQRAQMAPMLETLGRKYGIDVSDPDNIDLRRLTDAVMADDANLEKEAMDMGVTVDGLRKIRAAERERDEAVRVRQEEEKQRAWERTLQEAEQLKRIYPGFDFQTEMQNPNFQRLLINNQMAGIDNAMRSAYEVLHLHEIMGGAMQYAVQQTKQQVSNNIQSGKRPAENGGAAPASQKINIEKLTRQERAEIRKRVANGEHITFR
jgi:hypothetical protein